LAQWMENIAMALALATTRQMAVRSEGNMVKCYIGHARPGLVFE
jgi:hypothetical protein